MERARYATNAGQIHPATAVERNGLLENIRLLNELSERLERYFAMQTLGVSPAEVSDDN